MNAEVLISGAGPTGLMLACQLARYDVPFLLIDKNAGPSVTSKAMVVQARTLELYDQIGVAQAAVERGQRAAGASFHVNGQSAAFLPIGDIGRGISPFPFALALGQDANEKLLTEWLQARGHAVQWRNELIAYTESDGGILAQVRGADGEVREIPAQWLAGCDGAHSAVRHLAGIAFPGAPYEQEFFVADIVASGVQEAHHLNIFIHPGGFHLLFPMPGERHFRLIGIVPPALREKPGLGLDDIAKAVTPDLTPGFAIEGHGWWSRYRISHRRAAQFRKGRAFVLGDAAHIHSPAGGQGMNTGLQDACNLGWKLALVRKGLANDALLDSYAFERERVAQRLVDTTDRAFTLAVSPGLVARLFRTHVAARVLSRLMRMDAVRKLAFRTISQTGIRYRSSPLSCNDDALQDEPVRAGDRLPWMSLLLDDDTAPRDLYCLFREAGFVLLLLAPADSERAAAFDWAQRCGLDVRICVAAKQPHNQAQWESHRISSPRAWLIRPDAYIGWSGGKFDAQQIEHYLTEQLALKPSKT